MDIEIDGRRYRLRFEPCDAPVEPTAPEPEKPAKKPTPARKTRASRTLRKLAGWLRKKLWRRAMIGKILAVVLAVVLYGFLGGAVPLLNHVAFVIPILGSLGAFTYKGIITIFALCFLWGKLG